VADELRGRKVAIVIAPVGTEQVEFTEGVHRAQRRSA
jgi:hypothetical protein